MPAVADLRRIVPAPAWADYFADDEHPARRLAARLAQLAAARSDKAPDARILELKREMLALAPALRERIRHR